MSRYRPPAFAEIQSIEADGNNQYTAVVITTGADEPTNISFSVAARDEHARGAIGEAIPAYEAPAAGQFIDMGDSLPALYEVKPTGRGNGSMNRFIRPIILKAA